MNKEMNVVQDEEITEEGKVIIKKYRKLSQVVFITWALTVLMCAVAIIFGKYLTDAIAGLLLIFPAINIVTILICLGYGSKYKNHYGEYITKYGRKTFIMCVTFSLAVVLIFVIVWGIKAIASSSLFKYADSPNRSEMEEMVKELYGVDSEIIGVEFSGGNFSKDYFGEYESDGKKQKFYATYIPRDNEGELYISLATSRMKDIAYAVGDTVGFCFGIEYTDYIFMGDNYDYPDPDLLSFKYKIVYYDNPSQAFDDLEQLCYAFFDDAIISKRYSKMQVKLIDDMDKNTVATMEFTISSDDYIQIIGEAEQKYVLMN